MKKYITFFFLFVSIASFGQLTLSWPVERAVFQRDNSGNATVIFAGQAPVAWGVGWQLSYKIDKLTNTGSVNYTYVNWTNISTPGTGKLFRLSRSIPTGWYSITVKLMDGATQIASYVTKFGVGEVFLIAGQSNSVGEGSVSYSSTTSYDCIISSYQTSSNKCSGALPVYPGLGVLNSTSSYIGPNGFQPWVYNLLGTTILGATSAPVMFFNAGLSGSSAEDWAITASDITQNRATNYTIDRCSSAQGGNNVGTGEPYRSMRNSLNYYGSLFGMRGVIWHQGESDNDYNTQDTTYTRQLNNVVDKSRSHFNSNLAWAISNVSWNNGTDSEITTGQANTRSAKSGVDAADNSDGIVDSPGVDFYRQSDDLHFAYDGLSSLSSNYYSNISSLLAKTPVMANELVPVTITQSGSNKIIAVDFSAMGKSSGDFNCYEWTTGDHYSTATYPVGNCTTTYADKTVTSNGQWRLYMRDAKGNVFMTQRLTINIDPSVRVSNSPTNSSVYPNPSYGNFENTIAFDLDTEARVKLELITEDGDLIKVLAEGVHASGKYQYPFTLKNKGVREYQNYYYRLTIDGTSETKRIVID